MSGKQADDQYIVKETKQRLQTILRGAFAGPPTPLKDIPKRNGESRTSGHPQKRKKRRKPRGVI
jgi:hypothetical protein